jgi:penicillin-binding protein
MRKIHPRLIQAYNHTIHFFKDKKTIKVIKWLSISTLVIAFLGFGLVYGFVTSLVEDEPIRSNGEIRKAVEDNQITGYVYFNDQSEVGRLSSGEDRMIIKLREIPQQVIDAVIAIEDKNFYSHNGMDIRGTLRAIMQQLGNDKTQTGGSTITQQLSRRLFLSLDQTYERKAAEILLAMRMDRILSKDDILVAYLTKIYFGRGADGNNLYGVKSAAKGIFNVDDLHKLHTAQAAYLVGLPQQPNAYSAFDSKGKLNTAALDKAIERQKLVLLRMLEEKKITQAQYKEALDYDIRGSLSQTKAKTYNSYPFLMMEVERRAIDILLKLDHPNTVKSDPNYQTLWEEARDKLIYKGYKIHTTINPIIYKEMNLIAHNKENFTEEDSAKGLEQIGAIMIDNHSGAILGMIEGRDFKVEQLNHATQMVRQPGSAMKPIAAYLPALEAGLIQPGSIIDDAPVVLENGGGAHIPENWDGEFHGLITAREALKWSYNIPAIKLFNDKVGIQDAWTFAKRLGITSITKQDEQAKTGVIGGLTYGVSVEELTNAYVAIGNQGTYNQTYLIAKIEDAAGKLVFEHRVEPTPVFSKQTAYLMTDMMKSVVESGTAADLKKYYEHYDQAPFVGKTGSTQNDTDAWFVGYTPDVTVGVWAGYDQPIHKLTKSRCSKTAGCGTKRAKKIWAHIMDASMNKQQKLFPSKEFMMPEGIVSMTVSKYSGMLPTQELLDRRDVIRDLFNKAYIPTKTDDVAGMTKYVTFNGKNYLAHLETPGDMVSQKFMVRREKSISDVIQEVKEALKKVPAGDRKSISHYYPIDSDLDGPVELDPRTDDGSAPSSPVGLSISNGDGTLTISFPINSEPDVIGYRLYGSDNGETFSAIQGKPVSSQSEAQFTVNNSQGEGNYYMYVMTAVDVVGNESELSDIEFNDQKSIEDWFSEFFNKRNKKNSKNRNH